MGHLRHWVILINFRRAQNDQCGTDHCSRCHRSLDRVAFSSRIQTCEIYREGNTPHSTPGWQVLLTGWSPFIQGLAGDNPDKAYPRECAALLPPLDLASGSVSTAMLSWYANPLWLFALLRFAGGRAAAWRAAFIAAVLAVLALQPHQFVFDHGAEYAETPSSGAYTWAVAMALPFGILVFWPSARRAIAEKSAAPPREERAREYKQDALGVALVVVLLAALVSLAIVLSKIFS